MANLAATVWIPAFAGMTRGEQGREIRRSRFALGFWTAGLFARLLDSRFRGNDGGESGNDGERRGIRLLTTNN